MKLPCRLLAVLTTLCFCAHGQAGQDKIDQDFLGDILGELEERSANKPLDAQRDPADASAANSDPLGEVDSQMMRAIQQLKIGDAGKTTQQAQRRVLDVMRALLDSSGSPTPQENPSTNRTESQQQTNAGEKPEQSDQGENQSAENSGNTPSANVGASGEVVTGDQPPAIDGESIWGHLPERVRGEVISASPDQFLPQYRAAIIEYFRRLSSATETP